MPIHDPGKTQSPGVIGAPLRLQEVQDGLATRRLGKPIHYFSQLDSTNSYARQLAEQGAAQGEVIVAEAQTHGRGRLGRSWVSPPFLNLYCSVILRPKLPPVHAPQITLMAAVALAETVASFLATGPSIKWPNDILVEGKKLAGILTESSCHSDRIDFVILGIGVNLNYPVVLMPDTIRGTATSMTSLTQNRVSRELFLRRLIQDLDRCYGELEEAGFCAIAARWEATCGEYHLKNTSRPPAQAAVSSRATRCFSRLVSLRAMTFALNYEGGRVIRSEGGCGHLPVRVLDIR
jgi:BirA family biotin operon repressor/biotin-[acetyl-CoA-carboxylase] ligase